MCWNTPGRDCPTPTSARLCASELPEQKNSKVLFTHKSRQLGMEVPRFFLNQIYADSIFRCSPQHNHEFGSALELFLHEVATGATFLINGTMSIVDGLPRNEKPRSEISTCNYAWLALQCVNVLFVQFKRKIHIECLKQVFDKRLESSV